MTCCLAISWKKQKTRYPNFLSANTSRLLQQEVLQYIMCFLLVLFSLSSYQLANGSREWERSFKKLLDKDHPETTRTFALIHCKMATHQRTGQYIVIVSRWSVHTEKGLKKGLPSATSRLKNRKQLNYFGWIWENTFVSLSLYLCVYMYEVSWHQIKTCWKKHGFLTAF